MYQKVEAIVTRVTRYSDKNDIATLYTRERGRMAVVTPAGSGREAQRRRSLLSPLSEVALEARIEPGRDIYRMRDLRLRRVHHSIAEDPAKGAVAMFIADVLGGILREPEPDELMFSFLTDVIANLEYTERGVANAHICFMVRMMRFLGIEPDWGEYREGRVLDMAGGIFRGAGGDNRALTADESRVAWLLSRMTPCNAHLYRFSRGERNLIIDRLIEYYTMHDVAVGSLKTLDVLRQLFA